MHPGIRLHKAEGGSGKVKKISNKKVNCLISEVRCNMPDPSSDEEDTTDATIYLSN